jgi:hypothetical protein
MATHIGFVVQTADHTPTSNPPQGQPTRSRTGRRGRVHTRGTHKPFY